MSETPGETKVEPNTNPTTGKAWTPEEEQAIAETAARDGICRLEAIRRLRSSWLIGETAPPGSRPGRAMPKANPRFSVAQDIPQDGQNPMKNLDAVSSQASTSSGRGSESKRLPKAASIRQARWRARRKQTAQPVEQAA